MGVIVLSPVGCYMERNNWEKWCSCHLWPLYLTTLFLIPSWVCIQSWKNSSVPLLYFSHYFLVWVVPSSSSPLVCLDNCWRLLYCLVFSRGTSPVSSPTRPRVKFFPYWNGRKIPIVNWGYWLITPSRSPFSAFLLIFSSKLLKIICKDLLLWNENNIKNSSHFNIIDYTYLV